MDGGGHCTWPWTAAAGPLASKKINRPPPPELGLYGLGPTAPASTGWVAVGGRGLEEITVALTNPSSK